MGVQVKHAPVITREENLLWEQGVLNLNTPLVYFVLSFIQMEKCFAYGGRGGGAGGKEHRNLKIS